MIATIRYHDAEHGTQTATLRDDLRWSGDNASMVQLLQALLDGADKSPAAGFWVEAHLERVAFILEATVEREPKTQRPEGTIY